MRLSESLYGVIPDPLFSALPDRYDVIGDIAIITLPDALLPYQVHIAEAIIAGRRSVSTVLRRISKRNGECRVAGYEPVFGRKTITTCRESGFLYRVDLAHAFFTPRLAGEHQRIAGFVQPGETIFVPFAGVGPFVIPAASRQARVIALDINPVACRLLSENLTLNHLCGEAAIIRGDARSAPSLIRCQVDRAIIPTPYGGDDLFRQVEKVVKPGGQIHFYTFKNQQQAADLSQAFHRSGFVVERCHRCGNVAPSVSRWVYDLVKPGQ